MSELTRLKRIRKAARIKQSELANSSGVSVVTIRAYEQKKRNINGASAETVYNIAKALGCQMEDLLEDNKEDDI